MSARRDDPRVTRRQVLGGVAVASAASLVRPATDLAATSPGARAPAAVLVESVDGESAPVAALHSFTLVGISWSGPDAARIELRTRARGSGWSRWVLASALGHDPDGRVDRSTLFGEPVWAGSAAYVQLRSGRAVRGVRLYFVSPSADRSCSRHPALDLRLPPLRAGLLGHRLQLRDRRLRSHLGGARGGHRRARDRRSRRRLQPRVHGRRRAGSFSSVSPSSSAVRALERLLAWKLSLHGVPARGRATLVVSPSAASFTPFAPGARVSLPRVAGHRDGDSTDCPGSAFYAKLPSIRPRISALAGTPARVALSAPGGPATAGVALVVSGALGRLGGPPMGGAPVEVQRVGPARALTIASTTTAADGSWSVATALSANATLRALHRPKPATVSELVQIDVAPALTLAVDSVSPLTVSGTVLPSKPKVTIDVHVLANGSERLVKSKRVAVRGGGAQRAMMVKKSRL